MTNNEALKLLELSSLPSTVDDLNRHFRKIQATLKQQANAGDSDVDLAALGQASKRLKQDIMEENTPKTDEDPSQPQPTEAVGEVACWDNAHAVSQMNADLHHTDPPEPVAASEDPPEPVTASEDPPEPVAASKDEDEGDGGVGVKLGVGLAVGVGVGVGVGYLIGRNRTKA